MIVVVVRGIFKPDTLSQATSLYEKLAVASREEDGCLTYGIFQDVEDENALTVIESWATEQALETHLQSAHFQELVPQLSALRESVTMHRYEQVV